MVWKYWTAQQLAAWMKLKLAPEYRTLLPEGNPGTNRRWLRRAHWAARGCRCWQTSSHTTNAVWFEKNNQVGVLAQAESNCLHPSLRGGLTQKLGPRPENPSQPWKKKMSKTGFDPATWMKLKLAPEYHTLLPEGNPGTNRQWLWLAHWAARGCCCFLQWSWK